MWTFYNQHLDLNDHLFQHYETRLLDRLISKHTYNYYDSIRDIKFRSVKTSLHKRSFNVFKRENS